jgi:FkbM family methyltransferase
MRALKLRHLMTLACHLRYLAWRVAPITPSITISLKSGEKLCLHRHPSTDLGIAYEVFAKQIYRGPRPPNPGSVKRIVDLGANVGISVLYWAASYPAARIEAYEPHPANLARLEAHLSMNRINSRVAVFPLAVGTSMGTAWLTDEQGSSRICNSCANGLSVRVVDFFETVGADTVDLLKMDIEGSEYAIFMDERFSKLDVRSIAFEWHNYPPHLDADRQIFCRLRQLGWQTCRGAPNPHEDGKEGIGYAYR